ncbi:MAG: transposase [Terriglobia bacterium]
MAKRKRRRFSGAEKGAVVRRHLVDGAEISALCEELKIHPTMFYEWQRRFFEHGAKAFEAEAKGTEAQLRERIASLEAQLQKRDSVVAALREEHLALKKSLGEA